MEINRPNHPELTEAELQHLEKLKAVVETALSDGILSDDELDRIKSMIKADRNITYEALRTVHETMHSILGDELPNFDWRPN